MHHVVFLHPRWHNKSVIFKHPQVLSDKLFENQSRQAFGLTVRQLRKKIGIAQESLAGKVDMERAHIGSLERGKHTPKLPTIYKIVLALEVTHSDFWKRFEESLRNVRKQSRRK